MQDDMIALRKRLADWADAIAESDPPRAAAFRAAAQAIWAAILRM